MILANSSVGIDGAFTGIVSSTDFPEKGPNALAPPPAAPPAKPVPDAISNGPIAGTEAAAGGGNGSGYAVVEVLE